MAGGRRTSALGYHSSLDYRRGSVHHWLYSNKVLGALDGFVPLPPTVDTFRQRGLIFSLLGTEGPYSYEYDRSPRSGAIPQVR